MTDYCSTAPWTNACVATLATLLLQADLHGIHAWAEDHNATGDTLGEDAFVTSIASLGSDVQHRAAERVQALTGREVIFAPASAADATPAERDVELIVSMTLNRDNPGLLGVFDGIRERKAWDDMVSALIAWATVMLQVEAHQAGGLL